LRKTSVVVFLFLLLFSKGFSQPEDSLLTTDSDSLNVVVERDTAETVCVLHMGRFLKGDGFRHALVHRFSLSNGITFEDIDNSTAESVGELLGMRTLIDVVKRGPAGQQEIGSFTGNRRGLGILIDGSPFQQQDLNFPQNGNMDLNSVLLSTISRVEFLPAGLVNLLGKDAGVSGINIITKDVDRSEPYSKATANRGPYGFHRTQVELGRELTSRGKFYLTTEFKRSDGYLTNSDYDGMSLSGMDLRLWAYRYKTDMGLLLSPDASFQDVRKKVNNWAVGSTVLIQENIHALLNLDLRCEKHDQEVKSKAYGFGIKKVEGMIGLRATQTLKRQRSYVRIEGCAQRRNLEALTVKDAVYAGYLSITDLYHLSPTTSLLLSSRVGKEEGLDAGISACGGVSYAVSKRVKLFWTLGRSVGFPTLMDRFWPPFSFGFKDTVADYLEEGNRGLKSQKSLVADFGASVEEENYTIGAYLFGSMMNDFILWANVDTVIYYGHQKPVNAEAEIWGANLNLRSEFLHHMECYVSYSIMQGRDSNRKIRLPYSPDHSLFSYVQFENEFLRREIGLKLRLETNVISGRYLDENEQDREPGVAILNAKMTIRFLDFHFHYEVRNITDRSYRLTSDFPMPERSYWWGFYWEFFD
jgi:hypothetical protein